MKINELGKVDKVEEGLGNWLVRKGALGPTKANQATQKDNENKFVLQLKTAYEQAIANGEIDPSVKSSEVPSGTPTPQELAAQKRQEKQAAATAAINPRGQPSGQFSPLPDKKVQAGQSAFGSMAQGLDTMGQKSPVTTMPPGSRQLGPKGRETLGRLGKQNQVRSSGAQGTLDLNEALSDYDSFSALLESLVIEAQGGMSPSEWVMAYMDQMITGRGMTTPPSASSAIQKLATAFEQSVNSGKFPDNIVKNLYAYYASIAAMQPEKDAWGSRLGTQQASGGQASGGQASGGQASGGQASGGQASGGQASGGQQSVSLAQQIQSIFATIRNNPNPKTITTAIAYLIDLLATTTGMSHDQVIKNIKPLLAKAANARSAQQQTPTP